MKSHHTILNTIKPIIIGLLVAVGVSYVSAWTGPTGTAPTNNVAAPINLSATSQTKTGPLWAAGLFSSSGGYVAGNLGVGAVTNSGTLRVDVEGQLGATHYCDNAGNNCVTAAQIASSAGGGVPARAVMAFNQSSCPSGWSAYSAANGRNIVGSGLSSAPGATSLTFGTQGGEAKHTLSLAEMPKHRHSWTGRGTNGGADGGSGDDWDDTDTKTFNTAYAGGPTGGSDGSATAHSVMDPYVVLTYCEKD
jgi:hypothetical protein